MRTSEKLLCNISESVMFLWLKNWVGRLVLHNFVLSDSAVTWLLP